MGLQHIYPFWVTEYPTKTHLTALGSNFPTLGLLSRTKQIHPKVLKGGISPFLPCHTSNGDCHSNTREGILLISWVAVLTACPHKYFGTFMVNIILLATSRRCLLFRFCYPILLRCVWTSGLMLYSLG